MVARINTGKRISKALNYNEQKVQAGKAEILAESGFLKDINRLTFYDKMSHFERFTSLNERATTNTLHVSLNFAPSEKLTNGKMIEISASYMDKIGFGNQPYLVYRHHDAGHPHIHIVSTNIERDGNRISMHNLGRNQSEKARKEIEVDFNLVKAESRKTAEVSMLVPVNAQKVIYGKSETKRAIANVLMVVLDQYKFASLPELNAVLKLYNVTAERGAEDSRMFQQKGLVYRVLDATGNKVGTPIKASAFYMKPTLNKLEQQFMENAPKKLAHQKKVQTTISWNLHKQPASLEAFVKALEKEQISTVLRRGKGGVVYGITYVDHKSKCVFNGSDLGVAFSAKAVQERCQSVNLSLDLNSPERQTKTISHALLPKDISRPAQKKDHGAEKAHHLLSEPREAGNYIPSQLLAKKKRKKKRLNL